MTEFSRGDRIVDPDDSEKVAVIIDGPVVVAGRPFFEILTAGQEEALVPASEIKRKVADRSSPASWLVDRPLVEPTTLGRAVTHLKLTSSLTDLVYSFSSARTLFRPHQFKPVLKVIESPVHRLLLADEVGLGKTIEAGLIWTELDARTELRRVLIVVPPGLVEKWQMEMLRRFDREVRSLSAADLIKFMDVYADRGDSARLAGVISYPQLRNGSLVEALSDRPATFDLVICDEAHVLRNPSTKTHQAAALLAQNCDALILLSATPVNLGTDDLFNLVHLLRPDEFSHKESFNAQLAPNSHVNEASRALTAQYPPDFEAVARALRGVENTAHRSAYQRNPLYRSVLGRLDAEAAPTRQTVIELQSDLTRLNSLAHVYTRTRKRELRDQQAVRRPYHLQVELTQEERDLYDATLALVTELRRRATGAAPGLAAVMPARQAASCLPAMKSYVTELARQHSIVLDRSEGEEDDESDDISDGASISVDETLTSLLAEIEILWSRLGDTDSKADTLVAALSDLNEQGGYRRQVLAFSFFRLTLAHLEKRLTAEGYRCEQLHGGVPMKLRSGLLTKFRNGEIDVLLCSEVGSEGLDFEFCDVLVNFDLPWNPMRLEQRIGRLDRFGQAHPVIHILNFEIEGTVDTDIFLRLYQRINIFEHSIGELEPIMGETVRQLTRSLLSLELTSDEQQGLVDRLALAVESEQQSLQHFADEQDRLIGADAYVDVTLNDARENNRYLTPYELERYVDGFLREAAHPARLEPLKRDGKVFALRGSPLLGDQLRIHGSSFTSPDWARLVTNLEAGSVVTVTFDSESAYGSDALFLSHNHPIVRAATAYYKSPENALARGGYVTFPAESPETVGRWVFYAFLLTATGMAPKRSLIAVAMNLTSSKVDPEVGAIVLTHLSDARLTRMKESDIPLVDREDVVRCYEAVLGHVAHERQQMRDRLAERNEALISTRTASLERELEVRRARLESMATRPGLNERIERMRRGQIVNLESAVAAKLAGLNAQREVSVRFNVVLGGIAELV